MRILLKILAAPVVVVLTLFVWICAGALYCSAGILSLLSTLVMICGLIILIFESAKNGIILLVLAFLVSPVGLPMGAAWLLGQIQRLKYAIQDRVYG